MRKSQNQDLRADPVWICGESHIQRNANREVATFAARLGLNCGND